MATAEVFSELSFPVDEDTLFSSSFFSVLLTLSFLFGCVGNK